MDLRGRRQVRHLLNHYHPPLLATEFFSDILRISRSLSLVYLKAVEVCKEMAITVICILVQVNHILPYEFNTFGQTNQSVYKY